MSETESLFTRLVQKLYWTNSDLVINTGVVWMKRHKIEFFWFSAFFAFCLLQIKFACGQTSAAASDSSPSQSVTGNAQAAGVEIQTTQSELQTTAQALADSFLKDLPAQPTAAQRQAWENAHAAELARYQQAALDLGAESALQPETPLTAPVLPPDASSTMKELTATQAKLVAAQVQIHNQLLDALPVGLISDRQISEMQQREAQLYNQQQCTNLILLAQQKQALTEEAAHQPWPDAPPLIIPAGTSPAMGAFLTLRDQLMRDEIQFHNKNLTLSASAQDAALQQRRRQQVALYDRYQSLGQTLTSTATN